MLGQCILLVSAWLLPGLLAYDLRSDYISEQALGPWGYLQNGAFILGGLGIAAIATAPLRLAASHSFLLKVGGALGLIWGIALCLVIFWPTDPIDTASDLNHLSGDAVVHASLASIATLSAVATLVVMSWAFSRDEHWRLLTPYSALCATASVTLLFAQQYGPNVGLMQRLLVSVLSLWVIGVAHLADRLARRRVGPG